MGCSIAASLMGGKVGCRLIVSFTATITGFKPRIIFETVVIRRDMDRGQMHFISCQAKKMQYKV